MLKIRCERCGAFLCSVTVTSLKPDSYAKIQVNARCNGKKCELRKPPGSKAEFEIESGPLIKE